MRSHWRSWLWYICFRQVIFIRQNGQERREKSILNKCARYGVLTQMHVTYVQHFCSYSLCDLLVTCSLNTLLCQSHAFPHLCFILNFISGLPDCSFSSSGDFLPLFPLFHERKNYESDTVVSRKWRTGILNVKVSKGHIIFFHFSFFHFSISFFI